MNKYVKKIVCNKFFDSHGSDRIENEDLQMEEEIKYACILNFNIIFQLLIWRNNVPIQIKYKIMAYRIINNNLI